MMLSLYIKKNYLELVIAGFFTVLILFSKFAALYILLMALVIGWNYFRKKIEFSLNKFSLLFVGLYLCYLVGTFWTQDWSEASRYLENKVSFLLIPFLFSFRKKEEFNISLIYKGLVFAVLLAFLYGISLAVLCSMNGNSFPNCFLKSNLSPFMHTTYMSVYVLIAMTATFSMMKYARLTLFQGWTLVIIFVIYNALLLSLAGLLFFGFLALWFAVDWLRSRVSKIRLIQLTLSGVAIAIFVFFKLPFISEDVQAVVQSTKDYKKNPNQYVQELPRLTSSTQTRLVMWSVTVEEIKKHPLGVGTGNIDIVLGDNLRKKGNLTFAEKQYNPHNQYLQTMLEVGPIGFFILLLITIGGMIKSYKEEYFMAFVLFASLFFNCLFESMLQLQAGIIFYPFFFMLLSIAQRSTTKQI
jgi:O-antigen ligase